MSSYKNVLVAVDGSDESMIILQRAADMVTAEGATINVVQVFETLLASYSFELNMGDFEILQQRHQERRDPIGLGELFVRTRVDQQARHREFARFVADLQDAAVP